MPPLSRFKRVVGAWYSVVIKADSYGKPELEVVQRDIRFIAQGKHDHQYSTYDVRARPGYPNLEADVDW